MGEVNPFSSILEKSDTKKIFSLIKKAGFDVYIVGGVLRDLLLNKNPSDIDFATNAPVEVLKKLFKKTINTGEQFGSIQIILENNYEITRFRSDSDYQDFRHPNSVDFSNDLYLDASRRDFTINALYLNENGELIDPEKGLKDLENRIIRCIGKADNRFDEDRLRKWRAIRLAAETGFDIEKDTYQSIKKNPSTYGVSIERILTEFKRIILSDRPEFALSLLYNSGLFKELVTRLKINLPELNNWNKAIFGLDEIKKDLELRLAYFFLKLKNFQSDQFLNSLKFSKKIKNNILSIIKIYSLQFVNIQNFKKHLSQFDQNQIIKALELKKILNNKAIEIKIIEEILNKKEPLYRKDLAINGNDLNSLEISGKKQKEIFNNLLDFVYLNPEKNTKKELINYLKCHL